MNVGSAIRTARERAGLKQPAIAKLCGWESQSRISMYENNKREPTLQDLERIANACRVTLIELVELATGREPDSANDGLGQLSQEETDLVLAWRAWSEERRNVIRLVMRDTALQGHPCLEVARNGNAADQERANEILRKAQEKARAADKKRRTVLRRKTEERRDGKK